MTYDPQNAPDFYTREIRRFTDTNGDLLVLYEDQDGDRHVMDADEYDQDER